MVKEPNWNIGLIALWGLCFGAAIGGTATAYFLAPNIGSEWFEAVGVSVAIIGAIATVTTNIFISRADRWHVQQVASSRAANVIIPELLRRSRYLRRALQESLRFYSEVSNDETKKPDGVLKSALAPIRRLPTAGYKSSSADWWALSSALAAVHSAYGISETLKSYRTLAMITPSAERWKFLVSEIGFILGVQIETLATLERDTNTKVDQLQEICIQAELAIGILPSKAYRDSATVFERAKRLQSRASTFPDVSD